MTKTLLDFITDAGYTQQDFANKVGISASLLNGYIHGKTQPGMDNVQKMAEGLQVDVYTLVTVLFPSKPDSSNDPARLRSVRVKCNNAEFGQMSEIPARDKALRILGERVPGE